MSVVILPEGNMLMTAFNIAAILCLALCLAASAGAYPGDKITFRKIILDREFRSEGVAVADVNRDGKPDILAGNLWYEAPDWTPHEIAPVQKYDGEHGYSNSFINFALDVNRDGWPDQILIGMPGDKAVWRENPKGQPGPWTEHLIWRSACNESPAFADLLGNRKPVLVFPYDEQFMAWYEPDKDPTKEFLCHVISESKAPGTQRLSHGLGIGDINGDGRADVITTDGYYEAPADRRAGPWKFVPAKLGPPCAQMLAYDVNKDGLPDVISSSAHNRGVWWFEQKKGPNGPEFVQHDIDPSFSEAHAIVLADINGDGVMDLVTGKRFWAHGPTGDEGAGEPAVLYWYELKRSGGKVEWVRHEVDDDSGVGTQFVVTDVNGDGLLDIAISNKKGVFLFLQERKP
jgi:hypothetical protein